MGCAALMHAVTDMFITLTPTFARCTTARASVAVSPALRRISSLSPGCGFAGPNADEDCRTDISAASGAMPTTPSGLPGGGPGTGGTSPPPGPAAGATGSSGGGASSAGGGGGGGGAVTVTVLGFGGAGGGGGAVTVTVLACGGAGGGVVGNGEAGTSGGGGAASTPGGIGGGLAAGSEGCAAMIDATTVPCESQSNSPPFSSPIT